MNKKKQLVIVSGLSGAGKSQVLNILEDQGYYCVDNLPVELLNKFLDLIKTSINKKKYAIGMDVRSAENVNDLIDVYKKIEDKIYKDIDVKKIFLEAKMDVLLRRFSETRRKHPLGGNLLLSIKKEQKLLYKIRKLCDIIVNTSDLTISDLQKEILKVVDNSFTGKLKIVVLSFGFKYGLPLNADMVFDVRFLPNPNYIPKLRVLDGRNNKIRKFVLNQSITLQYLEHIKKILQFIIPQIIDEGKSYFTIAFGCTGGQHRSVVIVEEIYRYISFLKKEFKYEFSISVFHRDI